MKKSVFVFLLIIQSTFVLAGQVLINVKNYEESRMVKLSKNTTIMIRDRESLASIVRDDFIKEMEELSDAWIVGRFEGYPDQNELQTQKVQEFENQIGQQAIRVALFGDSTSTGFTFDTIRSALAQSINPPNNSNIFRSGGKSGISIMHQLAQEFPVLIGKNYSVPGSAVISTNKVKNMIGDVVGVNFKFDDMLAEAKNEETPADINLFWMGHNDIDWPMYLPKSKVEKDWNRHSYAPVMPRYLPVSPYDYLVKSEDGKYYPSEELKELLDEKAKESVNNYIEKLKNFVSASAKRDKKTVIVIYGLLNTDSFLAHRKAYKKLADQGKIPFYYDGAESYKAMKIDYHEGLRYIANKYDEELQLAVKELSQEMSNRNLLIYYSGSINNSPLPTKEHMSHRDGWHYSVLGHQFVGNAAFKGLEAGIKFLKEK